jgi:glutamate synthase domain-containing protein 2
MSFGSISENTMLARARCATAWGTLTCTGEGGYPDALIPYKDNVITQVATGLFGITEETINRAQMVEFKYAQGAKPGLGGHLLGEKVTDAVAKLRGSVKGQPLFSPFPFHSVYSIEDHKKHVDWIKHVNRQAIISSKVAAPSDIDMVAIGSYHAGSHVIHIDGCYGGTGAAPDLAKKNISMPIEYAINKTHRFLVKEGVRDQVTLIASGGLRSAHDIYKAIALGADGVVTGTAELIALECVRCQNCESGRGCARGIATTDDQLSELYGTDWAFHRLYNLFHALDARLRNLVAASGLQRISDLTGRTDFLTHLDFDGECNG